MKALPLAFALMFAAVPLQLIAKAALPLRRPATSH